MRLRGRRQVRGSPRQSPPGTRPRPDPQGAWADLCGARKRSFQLSSDRCRPAPGQGTPTCRQIRKAHRPDCARTEVVPGELVRVRGRQVHESHIPADARPGQRIWLQFEGQWLDFTVVPLADLEAELSSNTLRIKASSHLQETADFTIQAGKHERLVQLKANKATVVDIDLGWPTEESTNVCPVTLRSGSMSQHLEFRLRAKRELVSVVPMPTRWTTWMQLRGQAETSDFGGSGTAVRPGRIECGEVHLQGLFMHPPWKEGTGCCFALTRQSRCLQASLPPFAPASGK